MASKETNDEKEISSLFERDGIEELPQDEDLKRNFIMNFFLNEHSKAMSNHSRQYTKLLKGYIGNSKGNLKKKNIFKDVFFWISISTLILSFALFVAISIAFVVKDWCELNMSAVSGLITSLVGMLSLYIIIPKIIAKYLFNIKEDKNMAKIVKSIQKYDAKVFINMNKHNSENKLKKEEEAKPFMSDLKKNAIEVKEKEKGTFEENIVNDNNSGGGDGGLLA